MNLKTLPSSTLLENTETLVRNERRITTEILYHLLEIESRKAYALPYDCKSLHEYATRILKYSSGAASRRISAMHALQSRPELASKIESGDLNVCSVSRIETFIRKEEKISGQKMAQGAKAALFTQAETLSQNELEKKLFAISPKAAYREIKQPLANNLNELRLQLSDSDLEKWENLRGWFAHAMKDSSSGSELLSKLIHLAEENFIREKTKETRNSQKSESATDEQKETVVSRATASKITAPKPGTSKTSVPKKADSSSSSSSSSSGSPKNSEPPTPTPLTGSKPKTLESHKSKERIQIRHIPLPLQRAIYRRAGLCCEKVRADGERCRSTYKLQIHHLIPFARGGTHTLENLALYCADHNLVQGYRDFGARKMKPKAK